MNRLFIAMVLIMICFLISGIGGFLNLPGDKTKELCKKNKFSNRCFNIVAVLSIIAVVLGLSTLIK